LSPSATRAKLTALRIRLTASAKKAWEDIGNPFREDANGDMRLFDPDCGRHIDWLAERYERYARNVILPIGADRQLDLIRTRDTVWEGAQGVLLDEDYGFTPHVTWSRVTLRNAAATLATADITDVTNIGVLRAYGHRHGAGPFPSEEEKLRGLLAEPHNGTSAWQGAFRVGHFDLPLARYALKVAGGTSRSIHWGGAPRIDQLAITHLDTILRLDNWMAVTQSSVCLDYIPAPDDWSKRERFTSAVMAARPTETETTHHSDVPYWIADNLGLPPVIMSYGPTASDKVFLA
jgi:adenylosuccinate synthase